MWRLALCKSFKSKDDIVFLSNGSVQTYILYKQINIQTGPIPSKAIEESPAVLWDSTTSFYIMLSLSVPSDVTQATQQASVIKFTDLMLCQCHHSWEKKKTILSQVHNPMYSLWCRPALRCLLFTTAPCHPSCTGAHRCSRRGITGDVGRQRLQTLVRISSFLSLCLPPRPSFPSPHPFSGEPVHYVSNPLTPRNTNGSRGLYLAGEQDLISRAAPGYSTHRNIH